MCSWWSPPFGPAPLNALHAHLVHAAPFDWTAVALWVVASAPMLLQAYLLLAPGTRVARAAIGALGVGLLVHAWTGYRVYEPQWNAFNTFITSAALMMIMRYVEWSLLTGPIVDPWTRPEWGSRSRLAAALDLTMNVRGVFLGSVGLDTTAGPPNGVVSAPSNGNGNGHTKAVPQPAATAPPVGPHLPFITNVHTTRLGAIRWHLLQILWRAAIVDTVCTQFRILGADTIHRPGGMQDAMAAFGDRVGIRLLPGLLDIEVPRLVVATAGQIVIPTTVLLLLGIIYHAVATVAIASTIWPSAAWDVDLFDRPFAATSVIDLWGRRWHQVTRHPFVVLSVITIRILRLPKASFTLFPFTFFYSAVFHILAHLNMDPVPASWKIMAFFMLSAVGCAAEVTFKRVTGCPVGGWTGRIWATAFMLATGRLAADAWCDAGFMAWDIPSTGFGDAVSRFLWAWVYTPFRRDSM